ncbi:TrmH family RNA methyltransferase [Alteromonas aestuariivivens]|uniref:TrmH family RNA methyltransferase n=1 Tax=Alteromonas aestuariivivens TaxID=1938339 RepID=A0A3D8M846_9ALTE|nr:RNA methyltransferase [Alteromonas aestuariivivens]RDV26051.1 TrmH family RNA methyltransferase [Alteromonas aestuariivivens]
MSKLQPVSIGLINPKSAVNVASVLRAAGCYGVSSVFYTGQRYRYAKAFNADTKAMHKIIPTVGVDDLQAVKPAGARVVAVELIEGAIPLPAYQHHDNSFYVFGPEDGSIGKDALQWVDDVVYIPTRGCMNLAATVNVVLYDRLAKSDYVASDALIRGSRDNNNQVSLSTLTHN